MGCLGVDTELQKILDELKDKAANIIAKFDTEKIKIDNKKKELLEEREKKVAEAKDSKEEDLEKLLKEYNKKEIEEFEKDLKNEVEKTYALWELGLDLSQPFKNYTIDKLNEKINKAPSIFKPAIYRKRLRAETSA